MKKLTAIIEKGKDGLYSVYTTNLPNIALNGQGDSVQEAIDDMQTALKEIKEMYKEDNLTLPKEIQGVVEFDYKYDLESLFDYFDLINVSSFARRIGMNESLLRKYKRGVAFASEKQTKKIKEGLNQIANELLSAKI